MHKVPLVFFADRNGVVDHKSYEIKLRHAAWGNISSPPTHKTAEREWYLDDLCKVSHAEISLAGDLSGPFIESSQTIKDIASTYSALSEIISKYFRDQRHAIVFSNGIKEIELLGLHFFDKDDCHHYIARLLVDFSSSTTFPTTPPSGNGYWNLQLLMRDTFVERLLP